MFVDKINLTLFSLTMLIIFFAELNDVVDDFSHSTCLPAFADFNTHSS